MNKRQAKKHKNKMDMFFAFCCNSYKEIKQFRRRNHECELYVKRLCKYNQLRGIKENIFEF